MAKKKGPMTEQHKSAMSNGRGEGQVVRAYLDALRANRPKRGRQRTVDTITARLAAIEDELAGAGSLEQLRLLQERRDLNAELDAKSTQVDGAEVEAEFIKTAKSYSERRGITYATWREAGVAPAVLKAAGISRSN
jgi:ABC-type phosphate transport system auxiliary subunit